MISQALAPSSDHPSSLYDVILAALGSLTDTREGLIGAARLLNAAAILLAATFTAQAAGRLWKSNRAAAVAALLVGCNPVVLFRVGQIAPTSLAIACVAWFTWRFMHWIRHAKTIDSFSIGVALAVGAAFETSLILPALIWPLAALLYPARHKAIHLPLALIGPTAVAALIVVSNLQLQPTIEPSSAGTWAQAYSLFNNQEINDGSSYALHGRLNLLLLLNPIHWGLLIILAGGALYARFKDGHKGYSVFAFFAFTVLFAITFVITNGGGQNRLALVPLLAAFAAGSIAVIPKIWKHAGSATRRKLVVGFAGLAALTYTGYWLNDLPTEDKVNEYTFMAEANIALGETETAVVWAQKVLNMGHDRQEMRSILVRADFNSWALVSRPRPLSIETVKQHLAKIETADPNDPIIQSIKAFYLWKLNDQAAAKDLWQASKSETALSRVALLWTSDEAVEAVNQLDPYSELLRIALQVDRASLTFGDERRRIDNLFTKAH
jgi:uncharacterized membrane protein